MVRLTVKGGATLPVPEDQLRNTFKKFDTDNDNQLSIEELTKAFQYLGSWFPAYRADRSLLHADANNDGFVNEEEMNQLLKYVAGLGFTVHRNP
ncbi:putative calcium-binding protein cml26 [Quercus suber]|uniref:Calcium-binding protein cml26 n=1 Tax=Quercus suber TaxID=58331 RepID=A0AAW0IP37_QUESU